MIRNILSGVFAILLFLEGSAQACMTTDNSSSHYSYETIIDFNDGAAQGLKSGDIVASQWEEAGVTFGDGTVKWSEYTLFGTPGLYGSIDTGAIGSIYFSQEVSAAAFRLFTLPTWSCDITIQAKNDGSVVDSITIPKTGNWYKSNLWYSFADITFDEIDFDTGSLYWNLDNLKFTAVPIPSAILLLGAGLFGLIGLKRRLTIQ